MIIRLRALFRDLGTCASLLYFADRLLSRIFAGKVRIYYYKLELLPVPSKPLLPLHRGRQFEIREIDIPDAALKMIPRPPEVILSRYKQGSRCIGAFKNDVLVGQLWIQPDNYQEDEVRCHFILRPMNKVAWDYDVYIDPSLRSTFLFARLWDFAFGILREEGIEWSASRISVWNTASLNSHASLGSQAAGRALFITIGSFQAMLSNLWPLFHLSFSSKHTPKLRILAPTKSPIESGQRK